KHERIYARTSAPGSDDDSREKGRRNARAGGARQAPGRLRADQRADREPLLVERADRNGQRMDADNQDPPGSLQAARKAASGAAPLRSAGDPRHGSRRSERGVSQMADRTGEWEGVNGCGASLFLRRIIAGGL